MSKRDDRRAEAQWHILEMDKDYCREIMDSVATHRHYKPGSMESGTTTAPKRFADTEIEVVNTDSVSAVMDERGHKCVMNFASYHHPGGGYENGAWAQEEALCSESNLYNVLDELYNKFYQPHKKSHRDGLYTSDALYLKDIVFIRKGEEEDSDVVVVAAPNAKAARSNRISEEDIEDEMVRRVNTVMNIVADNGADTLIAGAFGCGVFANDPYFVAETFKRWLDDNPGVFKRVVFGIPGRDENYDAFVEVFGTNE